ncbi:MAG: hypothetical protein V3R25_05785 [Nitrosomonadaceae bacterium]
MSKSAMELARKAHDLALKVERDQQAHEDLCAERYNTINTSLADVKGIMKAAVFKVLSLLLMLVGFLAYEAFFK